MPSSRRVQAVLARFDAPAGCAGDVRRLAHQHVEASRTLAIAPAAEPAGLAALSILRRLCCTSEFSSMEVRAMCRNAEEADACRQAVCGALYCQGQTKDLCRDRFPALQTSAALGDAGSAQQRRQRVQAALAGVDTLVVLRGDIHPTLHDVDSAGGRSDQVPVHLPKGAQKRSQVEPKSRKIRENRGPNGDLAPKT